MRLNEIKLRDPFILPYGNKYYLYGSRVGTQTGFDVYISNDLIEWSAPKPVFEKHDGFWGAKDFWAPEVYLYKNRFYMFASFAGDNMYRGTQILASETPDGIFREHSDGAVTPPEWECLDGTLYIDDGGKPYMIFCHEWTQVHIGELCAVELSSDLKKAVGEPKLLFKATDAKWVKGISEVDYVTDGPFLFKENGILYMLWSSFDNNGYVQALAYTKSGELFGEWKHDQALLYDNDGGHAMIFTDLKNSRKCILHTQNCSENNIPEIFDFVKEDICKYKLK